MINLLSEERVAKMYLSFEDAALADSNVDGIGQVVSDHFMSLSSCSFSMCAGADYSFNA